MYFYDIDFASGGLPTQRSTLRRCSIPKPQPPIDKDIRDAEIYQRRLQGEATAKLAEAYGLTVQRIRAIFRRMAGKV